MTHDEMVAVILAHKAGKEIQYRYKGDGGWESAGNPSWDFQRVDYRIKPEPREWYLALTEDKRGIAYVMRRILPGGALERVPLCGGGSSGEIHVREVIE